MQNQEAARYARWAAVTAALIAVVVAGVYSRRAIQASRARHSSLAVVPATVQQQSAEFKFTKMEQNRAIFTIRASQATRFKEQDRSVLKDVWITIYGKQGDRNDNIHTRECSYEPDTGAVNCEGEVDIDIQGTDPASGKPADKSLVLKTSNLSFNRETGEASTPEKVDFEFPEGRGRALGVSYSTENSVVRLLHDVVFDLAPSEHTGGLPVTAIGASLEVRRTDRRVVLNGPAMVKQGVRELSAETISIELDATFHAQHVTAEGHPVARSAEGGGKVELTAEKFEGFLSPAGWVERIVADGNVNGKRDAGGATDRFSASRVEFTMLPQKNLVREMTASGGVALDSRQAGASRSLKTDALLVKFGQGNGPDKQKIETAETLAPGEIETKSNDETTELRAKKFATQFDASGRLDKLLGHSGVEVRRTAAKGAAQTTSAVELAATFGPSGEWSTLDETGNVRFQQGDRQASAERAKIVRTSDLITLDGSPVISDATSRTTAGSVTINQKSGEIKATGSVVSTYLAAAGQPGAMNIGSGAAHISGDALTGSATSGHVIYLGRARLWQGESVLEANQIEVWRDEKKLEAAGHVVAVFPQAASSLPGGAFGAVAIGTSVKSATGKGPVSPAASNAKTPTLWVVRAPVLTYWDEQSKARLEGGVTATSQQGELIARTLDFYLGPAPAGQAKDGSSPPTGASGAAAGGRQLTRVVALGDVVVRQGDRRGTAEEAVYTAADQKFVLSGGKPTISDANSDTTTGHSLTFFVANDTILIDSQEGSRTLTKHRVEK